MSADEDHLRRAILEYLKEHPQAKDTIDGIVEWWLLEQRIVNTKREVEKVLQELVAQNLILRQVGPDGTVYYSAKPANGD